MKIRINNNSVRLRLNPEDVTQLTQEGKAMSICHFPNGVFRYSVVASSREIISADFTGGTISVEIPSDQLLNWDKDDRVGFEFTTEEGLFILVEKDFQCLQPRKHENEDHLYPNPKAE